MTYYPRSAWGGRTPSGGPLGPVAVTAIHHTAGPNPPHAFDPARWRQLEAGEVAAGYRSLAYHFGVCPNGDVVEIRGWGQRGAATGGWNGTSVAIVFDGYFHPPHNQQPTDAAIRSVGNVVAQGVANGSLTSPNCEGHRTLTAGTQWATACPGDLLFPHVPRIQAIGGGAAAPGPSTEKGPDMILVHTTHDEFYVIDPTQKFVANGVHPNVWLALAKSGVPTFPEAAEPLGVVAWVQELLTGKLGRKATNDEIAKAIGG